MIKTLDETIKEMITPTIDEFAIPVFGVVKYILRTVSEMEKTKIRPSQTKKYDQTFYLGFISGVN